MTLIDTTTAEQRTKLDGNKFDTLDALESEAIHIFREVAGEFERPVILFSGGKDSTVLLHLAIKRSGLHRCPSRCCTSTPATTCPRCSHSATT